MKIRTVLLAVAATSTLSTAAFANSHDVGHPSSREQMSDRCAALESQYNSIIEGKMNMPTTDKAEGLHAQGVDAC